MGQEKVAAFAIACEAGQWVVLQPVDWCAKQSKSSAAHAQRQPEGGDRV
jgi:hypothetical protein